MILKLHYVWANEFHKYSFNREKSYLNDLKEYKNSL